MKKYERLLEDISGKYDAEFVGSLRRLFAASEVIFVARGQRDIIGYASRTAADAFLASLDNERAVAAVWAAWPSLSKETP